MDSGRWDARPTSAMRKGRFDQLSQVEAEPDMPMFFYVFPLRGGHHPMRKGKALSKNSIAITAL